MNNIVIHGRLTREPELKEYTNAKGETGTVALFGVAVNRRIGEETDFFNCSAFGRSGEALATWFHKGDGIVVCGEMQSRKKENITYWNIKVDNWDFAEKKNQGENSRPVDDIPDTMEAVTEESPF